MFSNNPIQQISVVYLTLKLFTSQMTQVYLSHHMYQDGIFRAPGENRIIDLSKQKLLDQIKK